MVRMRLRNSASIFGRTPRGRDRQRQYRRKPARCHPMTVSGLTITRTSDHRGHTRRKVVQTAPDLVFLALARPSRGPLTAPAQIHKQFPDVAAVILDSELVLNQWATRAQVHSGVS